MMLNKVDPTICEIIAEGFAAAQKASELMIKENPGQWYPCGFSWVSIKPARGPLVKTLKEMGLGFTSEFGGFTVNNPSQSNSQWVSAKMEGSRAFVEVIKKYFPKLVIFAVERID